MVDLLPGAESMISAFCERRFDDFAAGFTDDAVLSFPQSGERIVGGGEIGKMYAAAPSTPILQVSSMRQVGDLVIVDAVPEYGDGGDWTAVLLFEFEGDFVGRLTSYFGAPFAAPDWRVPYLDA